MSRELGIHPEIIQEKINLVKDVSKNWESYCDKNKMTEEDKLKVGNAISLGLDRKEYDNTLKNEKILEKKLVFNPPKLKPQI